MTLTVSEPQGSSFTPCPAGTYPARMVQLLDLGTQISDFQGETKAAHKLLLTFEICDPETSRDDGKPFTISKRFTASLHEKAGLRKTLESWRGRPFSPDELRGFNLENILGKPCLLSVVQETKGERTYSNISAIMGMPKGMTCPDPSATPASFDLSAPNWEIFDGLREQLQEQIASSPEGKAAIAARYGTDAPGVTTNPTPGAFDDLSVDIPF